jgi:CubicO group peptidase (beta-lactamase class C family)
MTAAMIAIEKGLLKLDDPVSKFLPEYAELTVKDGDEVRPAKTVLTVEHLMSMQGGLDYELATPAIRACLKQHGKDTTTRQVAAALATQPLNFDPGTRMRYSLCHDVTAAVIEAAAGMPFSRFVDENIVHPLGMKTMTFHPTPEQYDRMSACYQWDAKERPQTRSPLINVYRLQSEAYESGGAGLMGDLDSYILLVDALANDGVGANGARILSRESIDEMRRDRMVGASRKDFDELNKVGYSYALGVRTLVDNSLSRSPIGEFGWDGAAGAWTMVDVDRHIAAFYVQHVHACGRAFDEFHPAMRNLIYEGIDG